MTSPARFVRLCDVCCGLDDHPRHIHSVTEDTEGAVPDAAFIRQAISAGASDEAVAELLDPTTLVRHMDCCASKGCLDCTAVLAKNSGAKGDALLAVLTAPQTEA